MTGRWVRRRAREEVARRRCCRPIRTYGPTGQTTGVYGRFPDRTFPVQDDSRTRRFPLDISRTRQTFPVHLKRAIILLLCIIIIIMIIINIIIINNYCHNYTIQHKLKKHRYKVDRSDH